MKSKQEIDNIIHNCTLRAYKDELRILQEEYYNKISPNYSHQYDDELIKIGNRIWELEKKIEEMSN